MSIPFLIAIAVIIVVVLASIAAYLHWKLFQRQVERDRVKQKQTLERLDKRRYALSSIVVLCRGMIGGQVTATETSMRVSVLLEAICLPKEELEYYVAFFKLAQSTAHIPILDAWKALSKKEKNSFETERLNLERQYHDSIIAAAERLIENKAVYTEHIAKS